MKIAVLDWYTVNIGGDIPSSRFEEFGEVRVIPMTTPEETAANIADAEIVLCNKVMITKEVIDACPNMRYIGLFATGFRQASTLNTLQKREWQLYATQVNTQPMPLHSRFSPQHTRSLQPYPRLRRGCKGRRMVVALILILSHSYSRACRKNALGSRLRFYRQESRSPCRCFRNERGR